MACFDKSYTVVILYLMTLEPIYFLLALNENFMILRVIYIKDGINIKIQINTNSFDLN